MIQNGTAQAETIDERDREEKSTPRDHIEDLFDKAGDYVETRVRLYKLKAVDKVSDVASTVISKLIVAVAVLFFILMLNLGLAFLVGEALGKIYYGFFVMAGFYLLVWLVFSAQQEKWFKTPIVNSIIKKFF